jgi:hypothetical protein
MVVSREVRTVDMMLKQPTEVNESSFFELHYGIFGLFLVFSIRRIYFK